ncbi:beta-lactamase family protein [Wenzhouxiangella sp. XN79A]|uniref:serine hydrolase domain-containing protein n=1 Tax=Wenzhouxiangella sp. XN79A TaxID=2724193 RepID=UPI00144A50CE|nr:serine hydrolase domain-containing protein [Wenzhouxiangella sp. XN79A]NKI35182.1 beta-lactamase family protein [Wenzhouxiangella sp. XN79A]
MTLLIRWIALPMLLALVAAAPAREPSPAAEPVSPGPTAQAPADPLLGFADGLVAAYRYDKNLPGLTLAVTAPDAVRVLRGYGYADAESGAPVDPQTTLFRIGSISKTFIWTAAMMQVEAGRLDLDADVNDYLDAFEIEAAFDAPVTMRHLMTHTAGFEDSIKVFTFADDDPRSLARALAETRPARVHPPGARTSYSNWGSALAAHIVEQVAGKAFADLLAEDLLAPLGMANTTIVAPARLEAPLAEQMATGHEYSDGRHLAGEPMQIGPFAPAGAIASTAADMARWMRFHLNRGELEGVRLLSPETHAVLWQRAFDGPEAASGVSHGFQSRTLRGIRVVGHGGSTGMFNSNMMLAPDLGIGVFVSQNSGQGGYAAVGAITDRLIERAAELAGVAPVSGALRPAEGLSDYAGAYINNRRSFTTMMRAFAMSVSMSVEATDDGELLVHDGETAYRYAPVEGAPDLFENARGARIRFVRDADGAVVALQDHSGVHSHERVAGVESPATVGVIAGAAILLTLTTLLGFWRRFRQVPERSAAGRRAALAAFVAACMVLLYIAFGIVALIALSSLDAADFTTYPPGSVQAFAFAGYGLAAAAALALFGLWPAWRGSNWGVFRRLHYSAFALALAAMAWILWRWNFYGAPYI